MKTRQLETLKEVLHIADDLADLMCNGTQITNFRNGQVRDLDLTINCINAGHEIVDKQLKLNKETPQGITAQTKCARKECYGTTIK